MPIIMITTAVVDSLYLIGPFAETHFCCDNKYDDISNSLVCL